MRNYPEPIWRSVQEEKKISVRDYDAMTVAEVTVKGVRLDAIEEGVRILLNYISGGNTLHESLPMCVPVTQQAAHVQQQEWREYQGEWKVRFVMPLPYVPATLPPPNDKRIHFIEAVASRVAVIRFSGRDTDKNLRMHLDSLTDWLQENKMKPEGEPAYAFYNVPWTLPFMRRNEIMLRV